MLRIGLPMALLCGCYSAFLPGTGDSVVMALLHLPLLWWLFLGYTFTAERWRDTEARLAYLRFNGELLVLGSLIALGGAVFSALSIGLFQLLWPRAENFYMENIAVPGCGSDSCCCDLPLRSGFAAPHEDRCAAGARLCAALSADDSSLSIDGTSSGAKSIRGSRLSDPDEWLAAGCAGDQCA